MKLATTTSDFTGFGGYRFSTEESMRYIHKSGFRYLDYSFEYSNPGGVFTDHWEEYISGIKKTADELAMGFVQAHAPMAASPAAPVEEDTEAFVADNIRCIQCCAKLGIDRIVVHAGFKKGITKDDNFELNRKFYRKLLKAAEEYGVNILTENFTQMHHESGVYWMDLAKDMLELIEYVDHPLFHACWDTGHANTTRIPQDESLRTLGEHVYALHIQDNAFAMETAVIFAYHNYKVKYEKDKRLTKPLPLEIKLHAEELLYMIGRYILESYDCYEE